MDNNLLDLKANDTVQGDMSSLDKLTQSYMLLKKRICGTHELIKQYNDKLKECEKLKQDLDTSTKQTKKVTCNYNSTLAKVIKLELQNTECKKNIQSLTTQVNDHAIKAAADQQHIQQLICKIKDVEGSQNDKIMQYDLEKSSLQVKVKELEQELKSIKKSHDVKTKKKEKKLPIENENKTRLTDVGTNTMLTTDIIIQKPQVSEKCTLTEEFYNVKEDLYPIFCAKCEIRLEPAPLEKICKIMANSCPKLIEKISSPQKRAPSPIPISTSLNNEQCKTEDLPILSDTPPPHLQNQNNRTDFIPANLLPASLNRTNYCNNFPPESNLMNPGAYYIGSAPINHLSMTNSNATNQNNHCENIATMASSLSIISSLQKRIDTLETKVRKKLSKKKSEQSNSCCQHYHPNPWQMYDMNNSMQFNFIELWKKMANFYENKERDDFNAHKKSRKCKLSRLKLATKRLQSTRTGSWKVESVPRNIEQNPLRKKHKKSKYRYSAHLSKSEAFLNSTESIEQLDSDSDVNSSIDTFNDSGDSKMNITLKSEEIIPRIDVTTSQSNNKTNMNGTDDIEIVRNSTESIKSTGGETDSGILSDSVESGKLLQLEVMDVSSELKEHQNTSDTRSSEEIESCMNENVRLQKSSIKVASNLMKRNKLSEANVTSKLIQRTDEYLEEIEHRHTSDISQCDSAASEVRTDTPGTPSINKKRKLSELELKKSGNRQDLLRKLKKLKRNKTPVTRLQNVSEHRDAQNDENENCSFPPKQMDTSCNLGTIKDNVYVPKKKPRIAHVPKIATFEENKSINNTLQFKKRLVKNIEHTFLQDTRYDCIALRESTKDDNESETMCNDRTEEIRTTTSSTENSTRQTVVEHKINKIPIAEVARTNSLDVDVNNHDHSDIQADVNHFSRGRLEHNETKTELSNRNERSEHGQRNNLLDISITCEVNNPDQRDNGDSIKMPEKNDANETNFNTEETNKNTGTKEDNFSTEHKLKLHCPLTRLQQHVHGNKCPSKTCKNQHKELSRVHLIADKFVKKQLQRLIDSDWENPIHRDVIEKLASACSARIIAKGIVDFLCSEEECTKGLDNSHTPPAPLMTKSQQKIVALLVDLEEAKPTVFHIVQAGIEYKLFRLNQTTERTVIESLSRMYTVLARIKKDREKMRMFCCDALYCLGLHAIIILYTVFTCWPEILPNNEANKLLPKCMAHLVMTQQATDYPKLFALKNLLSVFYKYPMGTLSKDLLAELLMTFKEKSYTEVGTAIILLAKREGTAWTYKNIIRGALLPMIIDNKIPNTYAAFCLLGNLMRVFPIEDKDNSVGGIVEQLCDLINSGEGPDEQKEGVVSALLSLSRHQFDAVVKNTLKWTPSAPLHDRTIEQMNGLFNWRSVEFWKGYLIRNKQLLNMQRTS